MHAILQTATLNLTPCMYTHCHFNLSFLLLSFSPPSSFFPSIQTSKIHSLTYPPPIHPSIRPTIYPSTNQPTNHPTNHTSTINPSTNQPTTLHPSIHSSSIHPTHQPIINHSSIHQSINPTNQPTNHSLTHPFIHQPINPLPGSLKPQRKSKIPPELDAHKRSPNSNSDSDQEQLLRTD